MERALKFGILLISMILINTSCNSQENKASDEQINIGKQKNTEIFAEAEYNENEVEELEKMNKRINSSRSNAITSAVEKSCPAIVGINVTEVKRVQYRDPFFNDPLFRYFFGNKRKPRYKEYEVSGVGSGFIISPDGYILTNHHVAGHASKIVITMTNGEKYDAEIIGSDRVSDVALLKIEGENFPYLEMADSDEIITGEWVIAFGNPFGLFNINARPTVTVGVISNYGIDFMQDNRVYRGMIQTDAAISSGNSGGPLVNALGQVVGMNTVIFSTAQNNQGAGSIGIGFSIPINRVKKIVNILKEDQVINRNYYTGMEVRAIDDRIANYFKLDSKNGVVVVNIYRSSPAEKAGIEPGDIVIEIDGIKVEDSDDFMVVVNDGFVGQEMNMKILRDNKILNKSLKLEQVKR